MKLPELQDVKFNKKAGKETPVIRCYTTLRGAPMFFMKRQGAFCYMQSPFFFWSICSFYPHKAGYPNLVRFQARICGLTEEGSN